MTWLYFEGGLVLNRWLLKAKVIGCSLLILVGGTAAVALLGYPHYSYSYREHTELHPYAFNLTSGAPQWNETPVVSFQERIGITYLQTNRTPVKVRFLDSDMEVILFLSNVTKVSDIILTTYVSGWASIIVERVDGDAEVDLTVIVIQSIPPPPIAPVSMVSTIMFFSFTAIVGFLMLISMKTESQWDSLRGRRQPILIAFLILLSIILMAHYITGSLDGSFVPIEQTETVDSGSQMFVLGAGSPTDYIEIGRETDYDNYSIQIGPQINPGMTYRMVIQNSHGSSLLEATFVNSTSWLIEGAASVGTDYTVLIERAGSDVEIEVSYFATRTVMKPKMDSAPSVIQASAGGAFLILALLLGLIMEPEEKTQQN